MGTNPLAKGERIVRSVCTAPLQPSASFVWDSYAPQLSASFVQFLIWLLMQGRIQCRVNLLTKKVVESATCEVCNQEDETVDHIIWGCPFAKELWEKKYIGVHQHPANISQLHNAQRPVGVPQQFFSTFIAICCWQLWKRRNGLVLRSELATMRQVMKTCMADANPWKSRLPKKSSAS
jgi:hypothetical protein